MEKKPAEKRVLGIDNPSMEVGLGEKGYSGGLIILVHKGGESQSTVFRHTEVHVCPKCGQRLVVGLGTGAEEAMNDHLCPNREELQLPPRESRFSPSPSYARFRR